VGTWRREDATADSVPHSDQKTQNSEIWSGLTRVITTTERFIVVSSNFIKFFIPLRCNPVVFSNELLFNLAVGENNNNLNLDNIIPIELSLSIVSMTKHPFDYSPLFDSRDCVLNDKAHLRDICCIWPLLLSSIHVVFFLETEEFIRS
jgi:hypothetical protein